MSQDFIYALRGLYKKPLFAIVAVVTLALGIGANTAIFTVVNAVLLRPLPYPDPGRLVFLWTYNPRQGFEKDVGTYPNFEDWRRQSTSFTGLSAYTGSGLTLTGAGDPVQIRGAVVSPDFFDTLAVAAAIGRAFGPGEGTAGGARAVVLSHALWQSRFGSNPAIVGRSLTLNGVSHEVLGVMPKGFAHPEDAQLWTPLAPTERFAQLMQARGSFWLTIIGRLKPGIGRAAAQAEMDTIAAALEREYFANAGLGVRLVTFHDEIVGDVRQPLLILLGAVCFVLLIACANVANLLLTRAAARQKELAIRAALGAARRRLIRQMLTESVLLAMLGGVAGLLLAAAGVEVLQSLAPPHVPRLAGIRIDAAVIVYTSLAAVFTGLLFGTAPALQSAGPTVGEYLKDSGRTATDARGRRLRTAVAVVQIAVALVLLIGAGLLVRSFIAMNQVRLGFDPRNVLALRIDLAGVRYRQDAQIAAFFTELAARLRSLPGVESVGLGSSLLLPALPQSSTLSVEGRPALDSTAPNIPVPYDSVTPDFFKTLRIPLLRGRMFADSDGPDSQRVVIVNESFERRFFRDDGALGKRVTFDDSANPNARWLTIVGVVGDTRRGGLDRTPWAELYYPMSQAVGSQMYALIRTTGDPLAIARAAQAEVWAIDRDQPVASLRTASDILARSQANRRFTTLLLALFSLVALALAAIGIYGVVAYSTAHRTREIAIRVALGARRADVLRMVLAEGLLLGAIGIALGGAVAFMLTRFISGLLFDISAHDLVTFTGLPIVLLLVAVLATVVPALKAIRVDPNTALRAE